MLSFFRLPKQRHFVIFNNWAMETYLTREGATVIEKSLHKKNLLIAFQLWLMTL